IKRIVMRWRDDRDQVSSPCRHDNAACQCCRNGRNRKTARNFSACEFHVDLPISPISQKGGKRGERAPPPQVTSRNATDAFCDFFRFENVLPVVAHQRRNAEFYCLVAGIGEYALDFAKDDGAENIHVAEKEIARCFFWNAATDAFVHGL